MFCATAINSFIKHILPPYPKEFLVITVTVALVDTIIRGAPNEYKTYLRRSLLFFDLDRK
jgi:hypothetical protein